ncbi:MAG: glycerol kinase GlpK [Flavobacteriaceae bacterium]|nr:glycerol kinase GlpK [Flavobacteriaceae bacterium]
MEQYILALDAGTTSSRSILFNRFGKVIAIAQNEITQYFPNVGWVEHDPIEIWETQLLSIRQVLTTAAVEASQIAAIGIANQRETTVIWDRKSGKPIHNAIVWQDRRTTDICKNLSAYSNIFKEKTGLVLDPYFSGTKIHWLLENIPNMRQMAEENQVAFGTIDSWLVWNLTSGKEHITDSTNASRTLLFNIHSLQWDDQLLGLLDIPKCILPQVVESSGELAFSELFGHSIPISGIAGDQQAALFGQLCLDKGDIKNTYGTGCFCVINTGNQPVQSSTGMLTTIGYQLSGKIHYALEGSIFVAGALIQWLRDQLDFIVQAKEIEKLALSVRDNGGVTFIPALSGLGAPYWKPHTRGAILGITRGTKKGHIARAALEAIALRTYDIISEMQKDLQTKITSLRVDGGLSNNNLLMRIQSNILNAKVVRPKTTETTALGVAFLSGLGVSYWNSLEEISDIWEVDRVFHPSMKKESNEIINQWQTNIARML